MTGAGDTTKPRLLMVDDEPLTCRVAKMVFSRSFTVETAGSVAEAKHNFSLETFSAAIVDYHMPGETGLVLIGLLKHHLPKDRIFLTTADDALASLDARDFTYVAKPYDLKALLSQVTAAVSVAGLHPTRQGDGKV